jgi:hypothetical protein
MATIVISAKDTFQDFGFVTHAQLAKIFSGVNIASAEKYIMITQYIVLEKLTKVY